MKFARIFDALPPPKFLEIPYAGLAISDSAARSIQFGRRGKDLYITKYAELQIPTGAIVSGQINNIDEVKKTLESLKSQLGLEYVKMSLPEEKVYLFTTKIPIVKQTEIRGAVESEIESNVPVPGGELIFDYSVATRFKEDYLKVAVSAVPINVLDLYVELTKSTGLKLLALEVESQAIAKTVIRPDSLETCLIVNFSREKVGLYIVSETVVHFSLTFSTVGGEMQNIQSYILQEINKLRTYWQSSSEDTQKVEKEIDRIIICGENFQPSIAPYLTAHLKARVSLGDVWSNVFEIDKIIPEISFDDSLRYAVAVGLALPSDTLI